MKYDAVIIGAGIGGLLCGAFLAQKGYKIVIFEKEKYPGGLCGSFRREGYQGKMQGHICHAR